MSDQTHDSSAIAILGIRVNHGSFDIFICGDQISEKSFDFWHTIFFLGVVIVVEENETPIPFVL
jgi:hypothetical protein